MADSDARAKQMFQAFLDEDAKRKAAPHRGTRYADDALMALCEVLKRDANLSPTVKAELVAKIQATNLMPYRSYCREHLLDIGITNI